LAEIFREAPEPARFGGVRQDRSGARERACAEKGEAASKGHTDSPDLRLARRTQGVATMTTNRENIITRAMAGAVPLGAPAIRPRMWRTCTDYLRLVATLKCFRESEIGLSD
jgi:hypothetical protein